MALQVSLLRLQLTPSGDTCNPANEGQQESGQRKCPQLATK